MTKSNAERLRAIMTEHRLTRAQVATLLDRSVATVDAWLRPANNAAYRPMADRELKMLVLLLAINEKAP